jgi:hypothetical protein
MRIEVQVEAASAMRPAAAGKRLSPQAARAIEQAVQSVPQSPLRAALARLARRR